MEYYYITNNNFENKMAINNILMNDALSCEDKQFEHEMMMKERKYEEKIKIMKGKTLGRWEYNEQLKYYIFLAIN